MAGAPETVEISTPSGPARAHMDAPDGATATILGPGAGGGVQAASDRGAALILGHGAGGGVQAPDLMRARDVALERGLTVVRVEQPYRVAGRRSPPAAPHLDAAWLAVCSWLGEQWPDGVRLITGGRSSGARVACRTAEAVGATGVLCLAFPLQPPGRLRDGSPRPDRLGELDAVGVPVLVVQGERDRFGIPPPAAGRRVVTVASDHGLKSDLAAVEHAIDRWLAEVA